MRGENLGDNPLRLSQRSAPPIKGSMSQQVLTGCKSGAGMVCSSEKRLTSVWQSGINRSGRQDAEEDFEADLVMFSFYIIHRCF